MLKQNTWENIDEHMGSEVFPSFSTLTLSMSVD